MEIDVSPALAPDEMTTPPSSDEESPDHEFLQVASRLKGNQRGLKRKLSFEENNNVIKKLRHSSTESEEPENDHKIHPDLVHILQDLSLPKDLHSSIIHTATGIVSSSRDAFIHSKSTDSDQSLHYILPIIHVLANCQQNISALAVLVVLPTSEEVQRVHQLFKMFLEPFSNISVDTIGIRGSSAVHRKADIRTLKNALPNILIATVSSITRDLENLNGKLENLKFLVFQDLGKLQQMQFESDLVTIKKKTVIQKLQGNEDFRILVTGNIKEKRVAKLASKLSSGHDVYHKNVKKVEAGDESARKSVFEAPETSEDVANPPEPTDMETESDEAQRYMLISAKQRITALCCVISREISRGSRKIVVFVPNQAVADILVDVLMQLLTQPLTEEKKNHELEGWSDEEIDYKDIWVMGLSIFRFTTPMSSVSKFSTLQEFTVAAFSVLLCTDEAAEDVKLPNVDFIVHLTEPKTEDAYIKRLDIVQKETSRKSLMLLSGSERKFIDVLRTANITLSHVDGIKYVDNVEIPNLSCKYPENKLEHLLKKIEKLVEEREVIYNNALKAVTAWAAQLKPPRKSSKEILEMRIRHIAESLGIKELPNAKLKQIFQKIYSSVEETKTKAEVNKKSKKKQKV